MRTLGFVIPSISDAFYTKIVRGVEEAAASEQHNLLIASQPFNTSSQRYLELFTQKRVDGMVLVGIKTPEEILGELRTRSFPLALVQQEGASSFLVGNCGGAKRLTEHRRQEAEARALGEAWTDSGLIFTSEVGALVHPRNFERTFKVLLSAAKITPARFYDLRHLPISRGFDAC